MLETSGLIYFIAECLVQARPGPQSSHARRTLYGLSKTLLELLHCLCTQSGFARCLGQLSQQLVSQIVLVVELYDAEDIDPELLSLLQSLCLEAEPTPSLTYHTSRRTSNQGVPGQLETPPASQRSQQATRHINLSKLSANTSLTSGEVRTAVVQRLAAMKARMGEEQFKKAAHGRLTREQQDMVEAHDRLSIDSPMM